MDTFVLDLLNSYLQGKNWTDFTTLFSPNDFQKIDDIILNYFKNGCI